MRHRAKMGADQYHLVADAIRRIEDESVRKLVANHFARYFHERYPSFDAQAWFMATGGLVNPKVEAKV